MSSLSIIDPSADLVAEIQKTGIETASGDVIAAAFAPHFHEFRGIVGAARQVQADQPSAARAMRLRLKAVRVAAETTRKTLKADVLLRGRAIDGAQAFLELLLVPVERDMEAVEKAEERRETARKQALTDIRRTEIAPYCDPTHYALGDMPDATYAQLLAGAKAAHAATEEAARQAVIQAEAEAKAMAEAHAAKVAEADAERKRLQQEAADARAARDAADAQLAVERKAQAVRDAVFRADAAAKDAAAREEVRKARAETDRLAAIEVERREKEAAVLAEHRAAVRAAAAAPTKVKLLAFAAAIRSLPLPHLDTQHADVQALLASQVERFALFVEAKAATL